MKKDPDAVLDYGVDWEPWLDGDTLSDSSWSAPVGITVDSNSNTDSITIVWLSGGTVGEVYNLINHITTALGREDDRTMAICMVEK